MQALEDLLLDGQPSSLIPEPSNKEPDGLEVIEYLPPGRNQSPRSDSESSSQLTNTTSSSIDPLSLIEQLTGAEVEGTLKSGLLSGQLALKDIIQAGLGALRQRNNARVVETTDGDDGNYHDDIAIGIEQNGLLRSKSGVVPVLCTDQIILPVNRMRMPPAEILPSAYSNCLRLKQFSLLAAFRANAQMLGISFDYLIDDESASPFFPLQGQRPENFAAAAPRLYLDLIKPHLRPTHSQLKYSHHPWVDVIPCSVFRQRFLEMSSTDPASIIEDDLCNDIAKGGLICWGSAAGDQEATGCGAPWDIRSWVHYFSRLVGGMNFEVTNCLRHCRSTVRF